MSIPTEITVTLIGAIATIIAALIARESEKKPKPQSKTGAVPTPRPTLVFVAFLATGLAITAIVIAIFWPRPGPALPVGSVIPFWGSSSAVPTGYELCDGELVVTPGSPIHNTRKPKLFGRFIRGASGPVASTEDLRSGGATEATLTPDHLPFTYGLDDVEAAKNRRRLVGGEQSAHVGKPIELLPPFQEFVYLIRVL